MMKWQKLPSFWSKPNSFLEKGLRPFSYLVTAYGKYRRHQAKPYHAGVPVICVGNVTVGGAGKTPLVITLAHLLRQQGFNPHILSRGYGVNLKVLRQVDLLNSAKEVGDEPLLLAKAAPTWVYPNRVQTAKAAVNGGADILLLDDGFQNPFLYQDIQLLVVDGKQGFGNGAVIPAGPLREPLNDAIIRADAILLYQEMDDLSWTQEKPLFEVDLVSAQLPQHPIYLAFAGIGQPEKFFNSLRKNGFILAKTISFPDHHFYDEATLHQLSQMAHKHQAKLITTEKDAVKIPLWAKDFIEVFLIEAQFKKVSLFNNWLFKKLKDYKTSNF